MTEEQIRIKADDAWECGDYKDGIVRIMSDT
jgi:hypothetical protein